MITQKIASPEGRSREENHTQDLDMDPSDILHPTSNHASRHRSRKTLRPLDSRKPFGRRLAFGFRLLEKEGFR